MNARYFFNPFGKYTEYLLLLTGSLAMLMGSLIAIPYDIIYDGVINIHFTTATTFTAALLQNGIAVLVLSILLYALGIVFNRKTRPIDIVAVALVCRIPLYAIALSMALGKPVLKSVQPNTKWEQPALSSHDLLVLSVFGFVAIALLAYTIVLLFNGFKTATNAKKWYQLLASIIGLFVADIIAKGFITRLFP